MNLHTYLFLFLFFIQGIVVYGQPEEIPDGYVLLKSVSGDLDGDGKEEKVSVYNVPGKEVDENDIDREVIIFKGSAATKWTTWKRSKTAVGNSKDGGMMGDPFENIEVKNGVLLIYQSGGSSWKWAQTDKYRYRNNEFELIGYTSVYGKPCEYWINVDYNLSTGDLVYKKEYESCETEEQAVYKQENETFNHKLKERVLLQNRGTTDIKIISPRYGHEIYL